MYILTFRKSSSKNFEKGLALAESLGGKWDGQQMTIEIPDDRLLDAYEILMPLFAIIQDWSSTRATFNVAEVKPYPFILNMHFVKEGAETSDLEPKNCWLSAECRGWTCRKLTNISFRESGSGEYKRNDRYWYDVDKIQAIIHHRGGGIPGRIESSAKSQPGKYHLRVYENFHYGDESEAYDYGEYATYEDAESAAKAIVDEFLKHNWKPGIKPDDLLSQYSLYGEDPVILPNEPGERERFSARAYVSACVVKICRKPGKK